MLQTGQTGEWFRNTVRTVTCNVTQKAAMNTARVARARELTGSGNTAETTNELAVPNFLFDINNRITI